MGKRQNRKDAGVKRFFSAWREYKKSGGALSKREFRDYYRLKVHGKGKEIAESVSEIYNSSPFIPDVVDDVFDAFGISFGDDDISDVELATGDSPDYGLNGKAFMGIPNYITYGLIGYLIYQYK